MCLQGKTLYVAAQGSALVYAVQLSTGKVSKEYEIPGDAVARLACAAEGPIFASTASRQIHAIDPAKGTATKTTALGVYLGVTPDGKSLITGFQPSDMEYDYQVKNVLGGRITIPWDGTWGGRAQLLKYKIEGTKLEFEAAQNNAASNGWAFHLSPDGTRAMMPGGGGWRPPDGAQGGGYVTAIFSTTNLQTMVGQAPHATNIAFHPALNLAVSTRDNKDLDVLNTKSFKSREKIVVASAAGGGSQLLTFGGKGTTTILWNGDNPANPIEGLHFLPLDLTDEERAELTKKYGPLPKPVEIAAAQPQEKPETTKPESTKPETTKPETTKPANAPTTVARAETPRTTTKSTQPKKPTGPVEATAGFNDAKGINADTKRQSPYPLGVPGVAGGLGEAGWTEPWTVGFDDPKKLSFVKDVVQEGDGAVFLIGTAHLKRTLAVPIGDFLEVEMHVRIPEAGGCLVYIAEGDNATGPMWGAGKSKLQAIQGTGQEFGQTQGVDAITEMDPEKWYKVTVKADVKRHEFDFYVDDQKLEHAPLHFRSDVKAIGRIGILVEDAGGAYFDNIRVTPLKESPLE